MNFKMILTLLVIGFIFTASFVAAQDMNTNNNPGNDPNDIISVPTHFSPNKFTHHEYSQPRNDFTIDTFISNEISNITNYLIIYFK